MSEWIEGEFEKENKRLRKAIKEALREHDKTHKLHFDMDELPWRTRMNITDHLNMIYLKKALEGDKGRKPYK